MMTHKGESAKEERKGRHIHQKIFSLRSNVIYAHCHEMNGTLIERKINKKKKTTKRKNKRKEGGEKRKRKEGRKQKGWELFYKSVALVCEMSFNFASLNRYVSLFISVKKQLTRRAF